MNPTEWNKKIDKQIPINTKEQWERKFGIKFIQKENGENKSTVHCDPEPLKDFIRETREQSYKQGFQDGKESVF